MASHDDGDDHDEADVHFRDFGIGMFVLALTFGIIARSASAGARLVDKSTRFGRYERNILSLFTSFPYTVLVMLIGLLVGAIMSQQADAFGDTLGESIRHWSSVSPEVILFAILPILLFESAFSSDVHIMRHEAPQILALAGPGVILQTALMAIFSKFTFNYGDNWNWYTALMFGSMMSATDPVAVVALVKELGMNARIGTLIEGEGLMNDGSAIVLFNVFRAAITSHKGLTPGGVIGTAFRLSLGGPVVGVVIGAATSACLAYFTYNDLQSEVTLTIVGCYGCFLVSEGTPLHVSGVLAVVFCGLYLSFYGRGNISVKVEHSLHAFWHMAEYIADTLIFFVAGVVMASKMLAEDIDGHDWANLFSFFLACQAIRAINIFACWPVLKQGYGVSWQEGVFLVFGGLRGAIGLALALVVETEIKDEFLETRLKNKIVFLMSGVAFLSLIVNGTLILPLVKYLKLDRVSVAESEMFDHACLVIERHLEHFVESDLKSDKFLGDADYALVWRYVPVHSAQQYWHRVQSNKILLSRKERGTMRAILVADQQLEYRRMMGSERFMGSSRKVRTETNERNLAGSASSTWGSPHPLGPPPAATSVRSSSTTSPRGTLGRAGSPQLELPDAAFASSDSDAPSSTAAAAAAAPHSSTFPSSQHSSGSSSNTQASVSFASPFQGHAPLQHSTSTELPPLPNESPKLPHQVGLAQRRANLSAKATSFFFGGSIDQQQRSEYGDSFNGSFDNSARSRNISMWLGEDEVGDRASGSGSFWDALKAVRTFFCHGAKAGIDAWAEVNTAYLSIPPRLRPYWHSLHREYFSLGDSANRESVLRRRQDKDGHFVRGGGAHRHHMRTSRDPAHMMDATTDASGHHNLSHRRQMSPAAFAFSPVVENHGGGNHVARRMSPMGLAPLPGLASSAGGLEAPPPVMTGYGSSPNGSVRRRSGRAVRRRSTRVGKDGWMGGSIDRSISGFPKSNLVKERETLLAQMSQLKEALAANDQARTKMQSFGPLGRQSTSNVYNEESMEKARTRFMNAVRSQYQANHHLGRMKASVLRTLRESADRQLDCPSEPLHDFDYLESKLTMSPRLQLLARNFAGVPLVAGLLNHFIYIHLAFMIELASEFVRAHQAVEIHDLLDEGEVARELIKENKTQLDKVNALLKAQLPVFPEITHALKTQTAARQLLMYHMRLTEHLMEEGTITEKEFESLTHKTDEMLIKLHGHPLTEKLPQKVDMLLSADFLKGVALDDIERLALSTSYATEIFVEPGVQLFTAGETCVTGGPSQSKHGWFLLVRGTVTCSDSVDGIRRFGGSGHRVSSFGKKPGKGQSFSQEGNGDGGGGNQSIFQISVGTDFESEQTFADVVVQPGSTIGLVEQLLGVPFEQDFATTSYCHLLYIDTPSALREGAKNTDSGKAIFEAMFKVAAVTLLPPLMGLDNDLVDPLGLVSSRDRFGGWDAAAFALLTSSTNEADRRSRRLDEVKKRQQPGGASDGHGFLGIAALDAAVFLRPVEEDVVVSGGGPSGDPPTPNHLTVHNLHTESGSGGGADFALPTVTAEALPHDVSMDRSVTLGSSFSHGSGQASAPKRSQPRGFTHLSSYDQSISTLGLGCGGGGSQSSSSVDLGSECGSFRFPPSGGASGSAACSSSSSTAGMPSSSCSGPPPAAAASSAAAATVAALVADDFDDDAADLPPSRERATSLNSVGGGGGGGGLPPLKPYLASANSSSAAAMHGSASRRQTSFHDLAEPPLVPFGKRRNKSVQWHLTSSNDTLDPRHGSSNHGSAAHSPAAPSPSARSVLGTGSFSQGTGGCAAFVGRHAKAQSLKEELEEDARDQEPLRTRPFSPSSSSSSSSSSTSPPSALTAAAAAVARHESKPSADLDPFQDLDHSAPTSTGLPARINSAASNESFSPADPPPSLPTLACVQAASSDAALPPPPPPPPPALSASTPPSAVASRKRSTSATAGGSRPGTYRTRGSSSRIPSTSSKARTLSLDTSFAAQQWVIQLSGTKTYLLLRGRIYGRAEESSTTREVSSMIESVSTLAQTASELEHISEEELGQLHNLLRKLHATPVTPSDVKGLANSGPGSAALAASASAPSFRQHSSGVVTGSLDANPAAVSGGCGSSSSSSGVGAPDSPKRSGSVTQDNNNNGGPNRAGLRQKSSRGLNGSVSSGPSGCGGGGGGGGSGGGNLPEDGWFVREHVAPCLVSSVKGRVAVSARTVMMEIPNDVRFGAKAALCFLTRLRENQVGIGADDEDANETEAEGNATDEEGGGSRATMSDIVGLLGSKFRRHRKSREDSGRGSPSGSDSSSSSSDEAESPRQRHSGSLDSSLGRARKVREHFFPSSSVDRPPPPSNPPTFAKDTSTAAPSSSNTNFRAIHSPDLSREQSLDDDDDPAGLPTPPPHKSRAHKGSAASFLFPSSSSLGTHLTGGGGGGGGGSFSFSDIASESLDNDGAGGTKVGSPTRQVPPRTTSGTFDIFASAEEYDREEFKDPSGN